jgi:glucosyl-dolichyl phosphate glucuronosyltransferase
MGTVHILPPRTPRITVAVCTWNRAQSLRRALDSIFTAMDALRQPVQLVVVNNNCTDDTDEVVKALAGRGHLLTYVRESRAGLAHARNAAIRAAVGEHIVWTDDDVLVSVNWLKSYARAFAANPEAAFFGGPIRPMFETKPPAWLASGWPHVSGIYAVRDLGDQPRTISEHRQLPYGANFAVRMDLQRRFRYDTRLGRRPDNYWLCGEELEVLTRLLEERRTGRWVPQAEVMHCICRERQTLGYVIRHAFGSGQSKELRQPSSARRLLFGRPLSRWIAWLRAVARAAMAAFSGRSAVWLPALYEATELTGRLQACRPPVTSAVEVARTRG